MGEHRLGAGVPPIADTQAGVFTARQARDAGASVAMMRHRRRTGQWQHVVGSAYVRSGIPLTPTVRAHAAAVTWPDAVVGFCSAALLHGLPVRNDREVHVIVPDHRKPRSGLVPHCVPVRDDDVVFASGVRVTNLQRTIADCVGRLPQDEAESLTAWVATRELLDTRWLEEFVRDRYKSWGNTQRRRALRDAADGAFNAAERTLHDILRHAGIGGWRADQRIYLDGQIVARADVLFDAARLVVEVDGYQYHGGEGFQRDRTRQNRIVAAGYTVLRFTWADLTERPWAVTTQIRTVLNRPNA